MAPRPSGKLGFSNRRAQLFRLFTYVCERVCSHSKQNVKTGTSTAEQTLPFPINSSQGNSLIIFPGPSVMSINANGIQAGGWGPPASGSWKRLVSGLRGAGADVHLSIWPLGWGQGAVCPCCHVLKILRKDCQRGTEEELSEKLQFWNLCHFLLWWTQTSAALWGASSAAHGFFWIQVTETHGQKFPDQLSFEDTQTLLAGTLSCPPVEWGQTQITDLPGTLNSQWLPHHSPDTCQVDAANTECSLCTGPQQWTRHKCLSFGNWQSYGEKWKHPGPQKSGSSPAGPHCWLQVSCLFSHPGAYSLRERKGTLTLVGASLQKTYYELWTRAALEPGPSQLSRHG